MAEAGWERSISCGNDTFFTGGIFATGVGGVVFFTAGFFAGAVTGVDEAVVGAIGSSIMTITLPLIFPLVLGVFTYGVFSSFTKIS